MKMYTGVYFFPDTVYIGFWRRVFEES